MLTFHITTMGCKVNTYDTSLLEKQLEKTGFAQVAEDQAKIHVINSCAVTENSSLETHRFVKKLKSRHPQSVVVITGCVAQVDVERLKTLTGADLIIGNSHKGQFDQIVKDHLERKSDQKVFHSNIFKKDALDEGGGIESSRTRAFLKIQDGCNSFCSFCIIPFARGKSRSLPAKHLIDRVNDLHLKGFKEVVLTGVHCGDYDDNGLDFADLVNQVLAQTQIPRVRLSSLEPIEVTEKLWKCFENPRLCKHIHVSLQSANSIVLKNMKRKYGQPEIKEFFDRFSSQIGNGYIGMDVIVGFPGETEEQFSDTYTFLESQEWTKIHVFPYSIRPGTTAAKLGGHLPLPVIRSRSKVLRELSLKKQIQQAQKQIGKTKDVLILDKPSHGAQGLTRDYWPVKLLNNSMSHGKNLEMTMEIKDVWLTPSSSEPILVG